MTSVLKKSKGSKGKSESMQEDVPAKWGNASWGKSEDVGHLIKYIDDNIIGKGNAFCGPFGRRKVVYCDYSGSGRGLQWIEEYIARDVLPIHATQCTALSYTSGQSDIYRTESKAIIRSTVGAHPEDVIIFGTSLTRFLRALRPQKALLFVSSRETERQIAPWREFGAEVIKVPETKEGFIDLNNLEQRLQQNTGTGMKMIGFFAAASKLTGVLADDVATTLLLHQYGALSFWDYTLVAPSSAVEMNPTFPGVEEEMVKKDAVFFNCEKFVGGVQGPYVAVVKKEVFKNTPLFCEDVEALSERIEEMKTVEVVRAAIAMQLRDAVGLQNITERQDSIARQVISHIRNIPELILLGNVSPTVRRLPIFSLMVKHPRGTFLHHNFVCAVLNDVFGIQARGGLTSNLNYGSDVLGIDSQLLKEYEKLLDVEAQKEIARVRKMSDVRAPEVPLHNEHLRPGFCRVSLPFFMSESELAFVLEALKMVATEGWKILPQYVVNPETGQWKHHTCSIFRDTKSLHSLRFHNGKMSSHERKVSGPGIFPQTYTECLQTARNLFNKARKLAMKCSTAEPEVTFNPRIDYLRWFMLPKEAHDLLLGRSANVKHIVPFDPSGYTGARKSLYFNRSSITSSPILGSSPRHFSLSAIDDCQIFRLKQKQKLFYSRESSLKETHKEDIVTPQPVQFAVGESVSPLRLAPQNSKPLLVRSRCYSLGSDSPPVSLSAQTKMDLGLKETSPNVVDKAMTFCNCGSQTDLLSLDDPMISPGRAFPYSTQSSTSISDCSQVGRTSPTTSLTSHNSDDLQAYVKEMTKEIATEIKSEIREVISKVDDILENSDALDQSNMSINSISSQSSEKNSVSVIDVAEYLMGMSRSMASEVKDEIREMVSQVDEMMSPEFNSCSRKSSPPQSGRRRIGSGPELGLDLQPTQCLRKCPTSPVLPNYGDEDDRYCKRSPQSPVKSAQCTPSHEASGPNSISFNSSETSTPDTIIQVVTTSNSPNMPKSLSSNKLSDDEISCNDVSCRHCCVKKTWCQNPSVSSQDSGINMTFTDTDSFLDFDPAKGRKLQGRLRMCQKYEKSEVPDIIEGVPVCSEELARQTKRYNDKLDEGRVVFQLPDDNERQNRTVTTAVDSKRSSRSSNASSSCSDRSSRSSGYGTDQRSSQEERCYYDRSESECRTFKCWEEQDDSSACSDTSLTDFTCDDEGKWHCPTKAIWKATVEAIHEFNMIRPGDKVLVCLSGGQESIALLHTMHQYQFYARSKGMHFSIGALYVHEPNSEVDPLHLMAYCRTLGVKFIYQDKLENDESGRRSSVSKLSSLHRWSCHGIRRVTYNAMCAHGYGVAAIGQHLDDAARAFVATVFHAASIGSLKAHYRVREHDIRIIRPFIYVRERALRAFSCARALPDFRAPRPAPPPADSGDSGDSRDSGKELVHLDRSVSEPCGSSDKEPLPARRSLDETSESLADPVEAARDVLTSQELLYPYLFASLKNALHPLFSARALEKDQKEHRHRKKSVIQMKNGAPVYDSEEGTDEEPVP